MDQCEALTNRYLVYRGFGEIIYEPNGKNPPDFLIDGRIAVEVRRLNQNELVDSGFRGLEEVRIPTEIRIRRLLISMGPPTSGASWFANYELKRPVPAWKEIEQELRPKLEEFRDRENHQIPHSVKVPGVKIHIHHKASKVHSTFFVYGGGCDEDTGGWVFSETQRNLRLCIEEKSQKIGRVRHLYPEWWLVLVDHIGYGLEACDENLFRERLEIEHDWDKVILLNPLDPKSAFEIPSRTSCDVSCLVRVRASASAVPYTCAILTPRPMGRNCHERIRLLDSCAVPARDLTLRYLAARLKPCPDTNLLRQKSQFIVNRRTKSRFLARPFASPSTSLRASARTGQASAALGARLRTARNDKLEKACWHG